MKTMFVPINSLNTTSGPGAPYAIGITFFLLKLHITPSQDVCQV